MRKSISILIPLLALAVTAVSLPRLAVKYATSCNTCHIDPSGGGMRNEFGNHSVAFNELTLQSTKQLLKEAYRSPRLSDAVTVGFDVRSLVFDDLSVLRMQTDFYTTVEPIDNLFYHFRFSADGISENYGMFQPENHRYYVKAGRFYPAFGLHPADHTAFIRERSGHPTRFYLDGLSAGVTVEGFSLTGEIFDRNSQGVYGLHLTRPLFVSPVSVYGGASLQLSEEINGRNNGVPQAKALFAGVSYGRFTLMGEADLVGKGNDTLITYTNLTARLMYGLYLIAEYNFFDGDRDRRNGVEEYVRLSSSFYPIPFVQLRPSYTRYTRGPLHGEDDFFFQFHVGY